MSSAVRNAIKDRRLSVSDVYPALQQTMLRLRNSIRAKTRTETAAPPTTVTFELNDRETHPPPQYAPLTESHWVNLVNQLPHGATLRLEGARPLASPHLEAMLLAAGRCGLEVSLATDGIALEESAPEIYGLGVRTVILRLFGPEELHNAVLSSPDAFEQAARGALALKHLAAGSARPRIIGEIAVSAENHGHIADTVECALAMGADEVVVVHAPPPPPDAAAGGASRATVSGVNVVVLLHELRAARTRRRPDVVSFSPDLSTAETRLFYEKGPQAVGPRHCPAPWNSLTVGPSGEVSFCKDVPIGTVRSGPLMTIYNCPAARAARRVLRKGLAPRCAWCLRRFGQEVPS